MGCDLFNKMPRRKGGDGVVVEGGGTGRGEGRRRHQ